MSLVKEINMKVKKLIKALKLTKRLCYEGRCEDCMFNVNQKCTITSTPNAWSIDEYSKLVEENFKKKGYV